MLGLIPVVQNSYFCRMEINEAMVDKLATLSRLNFSPDEKAALQSDLIKMLEFINKINEVDTTGVEPLLHITNNVNVLREDVVINDFSKEEALYNASEKNDQFFKVPKVIKK